MIRWIDGRPGMWFGYTDMGPIQIPVVPPWIILTDRTTGGLWWLIWDTLSGNTLVGITDQLPNSKFPYIQYDPYGEPYINSDQGLARLIVDNGFLGVDTQTFSHTTDIEGVQLYARSISGSLNTTMQQIILGPLDNKGRVTYGFQPYTWSQTPNPVPVTGFSNTQDQDD